MFITIAELQFAEKLTEIEKYEFIKGIEKEGYDVLVEQDTNYYIIKNLK